MERSKGIKRRIAIIAIILIHLVGLIGLLNPQLRPLFLYLVPHYLLLMMLIIITAHRQRDFSFTYFILLIWAIAFAAEWIGIHTGWLFGQYVYGDTLGLKFSGVPLIIGANWFLLIYSAAVLMQRTRLKKSWQRVLIGSAILVLLDMLIEPVAIRLDYWHWADNIIPVKNYVCWFGISALMIFLFEKFQFKTQALVAIALLIAQFIFFAALLLI